MSKKLLEQFYVSYLNESRTEGSGHVTRFGTRLVPVTKEMIYDNFMNVTSSPVEGEYSYFDSSTNNHMKGHQNFIGFGTLSFLVEGLLLTMLVVPLSSTIVKLVSPNIMANIDIDIGVTTEEQVAQSIVEFLRNYYIAYKRELSKMEFDVIEEKQTVISSVLKISK